MAAALVVSAALADAHGTAIGTTLTADGRHVVPAAADGRIIVNLPQRMLFFGAGDTAIAAPIAVGRSTWRTPTGAFTIVEKRIDPAWHVPPSIMRESERLGRHQAPVVPAGPKNPLGKYWLGTSLTGIGIHGTNAPSSISHPVTHGCIRVRADDIARLFALTDVGTAGEVIYEPILIATVGDEIYLEVNPDIYGKLQGPPLTILREQAAAGGLAARIDWAAAAAVVAAHEGVARRVTATPAS